MEPSPYRLAVAQNVAANGRLFCILLAAANFAAGAPSAMAVAAVSVGFAWAADLAELNGSRFARALSRASILTAIGLAIATLVNCW